MATWPKIHEYGARRQDCRGREHLRLAAPRARIWPGRDRTTGMREDGLPSLSPRRVIAVTGLLSIVPPVNLLNSAFRHRTHRHVPAACTEWRETVLYSLTKMNDPVYEKEQAQFGRAIHRNFLRSGISVLGLAPGRPSDHSGWDHKIAREALSRKF